MKKLIVLLTACCLAATLSAQAPSNDNCDAPIDLGFAPNCTSNEYTNIAATPSDIGSNNVPSCFGSSEPGDDVWFTFTCPAAPLDFRIQLTGMGADPIAQPQLAVYRGDCSTDGLAELDCIAAGVGQTEIFLDVIGLTPGAVYFVRVSDFSPVGNANAGTFNLCVNEIPPIVTIDQGSSTLCQGIIYDTGGPDNDYSANEDYTFTICPSTPSACIDFTLEYFSLDAGPAFNPGSPGSDFLSFYDGPTANSPTLAQINGFSTPFGTDGGGGVCFRVQASSGCLTIVFQSDATVQFEGFKGKWSCSAKPCETIAPIEVETAIINADIVNAIQAPGANITITDINCPSGSYGTFSLASDNNDLGLRKGLVLTSGAVALVPGPNNADDATLDNLAPGDADLDYLSILQGSNIESENACIVEMDVFVASDELNFEYVFGSEEYPEYANDFYNDIFAFLASGPGIVGDPNLGGARNIAVLPNTTTPVQINSVNNIVNWEYYRNNGVWDASTLQYDGFTSDYLGIKKSLTARVGVIPCNTYHLKLAVADRGDQLYDSGVFISEVRGGAPELSVDFASGLDYFIESCSGDQDQLIIRLSQPKSTATTYTVTVGGSATPNLDYLLNLPPTVTFQPGDTVLSFPIIPLADLEIEDSETITITLAKDFGCGAVVFQTITIELRDEPVVQINKGVDTVYVCPGGTAQLLASGALNYFWTPPLAVSDPNVSNPTISPTQDILLKVSGSVGSCLDVDSVFVKIINIPSLDIQPNGPANICLGDSLQLTALSNAGSANLAWTPKTRLSDPASPTPLAYPLSTTTYTATLSVPGCPAISEQITLNVDTLFFPNIPNASISICQNYPVALAEVLQTSTQYLWTPAVGLSDSSSSGPIALPDQSTTYTLTATSASGACSQTATVAVNITPADVDILGQDKLEICLGDTVNLTATANPAGAVVSWQPGFYVSPGTGPNVTTAPDETITVLASYNINGCLVVDSVQIRVDSLPNLAIIAEPDKTLYCPGDTIYLLSPTYEPANFPGMTQMWAPFGGQLTPVENWNMVIEATTTNTFKRLTFNHACTDTAEILIPVGIPPTLIATADPPEFCVGGSSQINLVVMPDQAVEWDDPTNTLSSTTSKNPTASPSQTTTYMVSAPEATCPGGTSITITVLPLPALDLSPKMICLGDNVVLNDIPTTNPLDVYTWTVVPPGDPGSLSDPNIPSPTAEPLTTTTYQVDVSGKCPNQGQVTVTVSNATIDAGADQTVCPGASVTLNASTTGTPGTITWNPGPGTGPSLTVTPGANTVYTAVLTFQPNCTVSDAVAVNVLPGIFLSAISAEPSADTICEGNPILLQVTANPPDANFVWTANGALIPNTNADSVQVYPPGDVQPVRVDYLVTATDSFGCTAVSGPITQWVKRCFVFPNAFTPDNDGNNDVFGGLLNTGAEGALEILTFRVFSRWGQQVFEATGSQKTWDGKIDGKDAPSDVYVYYISVRFGNGDEQTFKGNVTLLR